MIHDQGKATTLIGFITKLKQINDDLEHWNPNTPIPLYRGHSSTTFDLVPSALRTETLQNHEHTIIRELVASHPNEFVNDKSTLEQLARAQHYSAPTRLLDVTSNPLIALYFAVNERPTENAHAFQFLLQRKLIKFYDSDVVSCIANLCHLKKFEKDQIEELLNAGVGSIEAFNREPVIDRLLQFIKTEKPHFRPIIQPVHLRSTVAVKPKQNSSRIIAQSGAFMLVGLLQDLKNEPPRDLIINRITIPASAKEQIRDELDAMSINDRTLFPEIEKSARYFKNKYENDEHTEKPEKQKRRTTGSFFA